jgi:hypothetical protein
MLCALLSLDVLIDDPYDSGHYDSGHYRGDAFYSQLDYPVKLIFIFIGPIYFRQEIALHERTR